MKLPSFINFGLPSFIDSPETEEAESVNLLNGLYAYYRFNGNGVDSSGNGRNVSPFPSYTTGKLAQAYAFPIAAQYVPVFIGKPNTVDWSLSCWLNTNTTTGQMAVNLASGLQGVGLRRTATTVRLSLNSANQEIVQDSSVLTNDWHHCVATGKSGTAKFYVDNVLVGSVVINDVSDSDFYSFNLQGHVDEAAYYTRALNLLEIAALYNSGNGFDPTA